MTTTLTTVTIAGPSARRSKMQKKGWKCWAKWLTSVATPANSGFAYEGEFTDTDTTVEAAVGDVLLHVDQSAYARIGVVMVNRSGEGYVRYIASANSDGRKWCGPLARHARSLLAMETEERVRYVAKLIAETPSEKRTPEVQAYWEELAGIQATPAETTDQADPRAVAIEQIKALMAEHGISAADLT